MVSEVVSSNLPVCADAVCHLCGGHALYEFVEFRKFCRVTSDCRPWPAGGRLHICFHCRGVQKNVDSAWRREAGAIYDNYAIYHQAQGAEQAVFDQASGRPSPRSRRLLKAVRDHVCLPERGRMLDIGCGNGAMLRAFHEVLPAWSLAGTEISDRHRDAIESIDRAEPLYTCTPDQVPGAFDLVTLVHVLEHLEDPAGFLVSLRPKLKPGGLLLAHVPHHVSNPFELVIADHCTHFTATTATELLQRLGFEVSAVADDWVARELTIIAKDAAVVRRHSCESAGTSCARQVVAQRLSWLRSVAALARQLASEGRFGLFGTSIGANWLFGELQGAVRFFVDEDPNRAGRTCLDRPIYLPREVPRGSHVLLALPVTLARDVLRRTARSDVTFHLPPPQEWR